MKAVRAVAASASRAWTAVRTFMGRRRLLPSGERVGTLGFFAAAAFLIYAWGVVSADFRLFPSGVIQNAYKLTLGLLEANTALRYTPHLFAPQGGQPPPGVSRAHEEEGSAVSFTSNHAPEIHLIDRSGRLLHTWRSPFPPKELERLHTGLFRPFVYYFTRYRILANGDVLGLLYSYSLYPNELALIKMDSESGLVWSNAERRFHHDIEIAPDGRIFTLASEEVAAAPRDLGMLQSPLIMEHVVILDGGTGKIIEDISLLHAIRNSGFDYFLSDDIIPGANRYGDYLHANAVRYITPEFAAGFPHGEAGDLLISMRNIHALGVLNIAQRKFVWMSRGPWIGQHDPDLLENGNILLFDNLGSDKQGGRSRIMEIDPRTMAVVWSWQGDAGQPFDTFNRGSQQRLENGNTLITESNAGRIFEVTPDGAVAWDWRNPLRKGKRTDLVPVVNGGEEIRMDALTPEFRARLTEAGRTARAPGVPETKDAEPDLAGMEDCEEVCVPPEASPEAQR